MVSMEWKEGNFLPTHELEMPGKFGGVQACRKVSGGDGNRNIHAKTRWTAGLLQVLIHGLSDAAGARNSPYPSENPLEGRTTSETQP